MDLNMRFVNIKSHAALRPAVERRLRFALGRFDNRIERADVLLSDVNGPRGGADQQCRMTLKLRGGEPLVIEVTDVDPLAAVSRVAERAARRVRERVNRRRQLRRQLGA